LEVTDNGCGMDEFTQAHLFEPFFTTKEEGKGTGLGLAMVYGFVQQSGGVLAVDSAPGRGTTVSLRLPASAGAAEEPAPPPSVPPPAGRESILLVEDEPQVRALLRAVLEEAGYTVLVAGHAGEALFLAERYGGIIRLLLTDVVLPRM